MPQIISDTNLGSSLGSAAGEGLVGSLQYLANKKIGDMSRQRQVNDAFGFWKSMGYGDEKAHAIANASPDLQKTILDGIESMGQRQQAGSQYQGQEQYAPSVQQQRSMQQPSNLNLGSLSGSSTGQPSFQNILQALAGGQPIAQNQALNRQQEQLNPLLRNALEQQALQQVAPQGESIPVSTVIQGQQAPNGDHIQQRVPPRDAPIQLQAMQEPVYHGKRSQGSSKSLSVGEQKRRDTIVNQYASLEDMVETADEILRDLENPEASTGLIQRGIASVNPALLNETTARLNKNYAHLYNLKTESSLNRLTDFRAKSLEKDKPSLSNSISINKQMTQRYKNEALKAMKSLEKRNPDLGLAPGNREVGQDEANTGDFVEGGVYEDNGQRVVFRGGKFVPYAGGIRNA